MNNHLISMAAQAFWRHILSLSPGTGLTDWLHLRHIYFIPTLAKKRSASSFFFCLRIPRILTENVSLITRKPLGIKYRRFIEKKYLYTRANSKEVYHILYT